MDPAVEQEFRERELAVLEGELELKRKQRMSRSPLFLAVGAAVIAAYGNIGAVAINGFFDRSLEAQRAEDARVLEMLQTGDPDKAAVNLQFLIDTKLVSNPDTVSNLNEYLVGRAFGEGVFLPFVGGTTFLDCGEKGAKLAAPADEASQLFFDYLCAGEAKIAPIIEPSENDLAEPESPPEQ